jgi:hypothetical protein
VAGGGLQALALEQPAAGRRRAQVLDVRDVAAAHAPREDDVGAPDGRRGLVVGGRGDGGELHVVAAGGVVAADVAPARPAALVDGGDVVVAVGAQRDVEGPRRRRDAHRRRRLAGHRHHERVAAGGAVVARPGLPAAVRGHRRLAGDLGHGLIGGGRRGGDEREGEDGGRKEAAHGHVTLNGRRRRRCRSVFAHGPRPRAHRIPSAMSWRWWASLHVTGKWPSAS